MIPDCDVVSAGILTGCLDPSFAYFFSHKFYYLCILLVQGPRVPYFLQEWVLKYSDFILVDSLCGTYVGFHCNLLAKVIYDPRSMFFAFRAP